MCTGETELGGFHPSWEQIINHVHENRCHQVVPATIVIFFIIIL